MRLLREGTVIHQGELSTLRRFKDDVKEVANGYECGMGFLNYDDIRVDDQIECYEVETVGPDGWLVSNRLLHRRRAPGNTCLSS